MPSAPFLRLTGVTKRYGRVSALAGIDLEVAADELLVVLGPTGAGKTTLLRTIVGLERPDAGTLELAGADLGAVPPASRDMALVFQNFSLYPDWSVRRNLEFPLRAPGRRLAAAEIGARVAWAADLLRLSRLLDRPANLLSGGEMQRVAIGRAIVRRPRLFLMDEPLTNLDAKLRETLRVELTVLRRHLRTPLVFVTHDQLEALSMADRIVVLGAGRVLQSGTPEEVYRRPVTPAVARQLGQPRINVVAVTRNGADWCGPDGTPLLPAAAGTAMGPRAERMLLGIRPEDLDTAGGSAAAVVRLVEENGADKILVIRWAGADFHVLTHRRAPYHPGATIRPTLDAARAILWPAT